jgi:hypothetical protein
MSTPAPLDRAEVAWLLARARVAYVAVETSSGPHVTPAAFAVSAGRLWLASSRGTVKVRAIRRRPVVSLLLREGDRTLVIAGAARVISPWGRDDIAALAGNVVGSARAAAAYALRNRGLLGGYLRDLVGLTPGAFPHDRVAVTVAPQRGLVLHGTTVIDRWGRWAGNSPLHLRAGTAGLDRSVRLDDLPAPALAALRDDAEPALGWLCPSGPVALPGQSLIGTTSLEVSAQALRIVHAPARSRACVTVDRADGSRPSRFAGVILRGDGRVAQRRSASARVALSADRVTWWAGFHSGTISAGRATGQRAA